MTDIKVVDIDVIERRLERKLRYFNAQPRIYVHPQNESVLQNLAFRFDRPYQAYRQVLPQALEALGLPSDTKCSWSQKAGCPCGCSPGFVVKISSLLRKDVYVTVEGVEQPMTNRAVDRASQVASDPTLAALLR